MPQIRPFEVHIPQTDIDALRARIDHSRWPDLPLGDDWAAGVGADFLRTVMAAWRHYDWRALERRINAFDNVLVDIDGHSIHALHQRSRSGHAEPLLLIHGWPGSFLEFIELAEPLAAEGDTSFHVVCPSIPGYGFSGKPTAPGMQVERVAELFVALMTALGYERFYVQGGDWGALIATQIARRFPQHCLGLHLNLLTAPTPAVDDPMALVAPEELPWLQEAEQLWRTGMGYYAIQSTRPHTPAYGLNDSPLGLAAWLGEKFMAWSDHGGEHRLGMPLDALLAHLSLYWFTQTIGTAMRFYYEEAQRAPQTGFVDVPTGVAILPRELVRTPRGWAERAFNIVHWQPYQRGGHFAALEVPQSLIADIRNFVQTVRRQRDA